MQIDPAEEYKRLYEEAIQKLNNWEKLGKTPEEALNEISSGNDNKKELEEWKKVFSNKEPKKAFEELEKIKAEKDARPNITIAKHRELLENQKPKNLPSDWEQQIVDKDKYLRERDARPNIKKEDWEKDYSQRPDQEQVNEILSGLRIPEEDKKEVKDYLNKYKDVLERSVQNFENLKKADKKKEGVYNIEQRNLQARVEKINNFVLKIDNWGKK